MAATLDSYAPFSTGAGANATEDTWREIFKYMAGSGVYRNVANSCEPYGSGLVLQIKVKTGEVYIRGHWGKISSEKTLAIAANASGFARKDLVVARLRADTDLIEVDVVTGVGAASPAVPALTRNSSIWEIPLGVVDVPNGDSTIEAGQVTPTRRFIGQRPVMHRLRTVGLTVAFNNALTDYVTLTFTPTTDCYPGIHLTVNAQVDAGASGDAAEPCAFLLGYKIKRVSDGVTVFTGDQLFPGEVIDYNLLTIRGKSGTPITDVADIALTADVAYQLIIFGTKSTVLNGKINSVIGSITEVVKSE